MNGGQFRSAPLLDRFALPLTDAVADDAAGTRGKIRVIELRNIAVNNALDMVAARAVETAAVAPAGEVDAPRGVVAAPPVGVAPMIVAAPPAAVAPDNNPLAATDPAWAEAEAAAAPVAVAPATTPAPDPLPVEPPPALTITSTLLS